MGRIAENDPAFLLKENVRILLTSVHETQKKVLGFSWRKLFPFNIYFRKIDFPAYARYLAKVREALDEQRHACLNHPARELSPEHKRFFNAMEHYLLPLGESVDHLREIALMMADQAALAEINAETARYGECCKSYHERAGELARTWSELVNARGEKEPSAEAEGGKKAE